MNKKGKNYFMYFLTSRNRRREKKRKEAEELRIWWMQHGMKPYSKPKVFFLTIWGLFLGLFESKSKTVKNNDLNLKKIKSQEMIKQDEDQLENIIKKVENIERQLQNSLKKQTLREYEEILTREKENVVQLQKKYQVLKPMKSDLTQNIIASLAVIKMAQVAATKTQKILEKTTEKKERLDFTVPVKINEKQLKDKIPSILVKKENIQNIKIEKVNTPNKKIISKISPKSSLKIEVLEVPINSKRNFTSLTEKQALEKLSKFEMGISNEQDLETLKELSVDLEKFLKEQKDENSYIEVIHRGTNIQEKLKEKIINLELTLYQQMLSSIDTIKSSNDKIILKKEAEILKNLVSKVDKRTNKVETRKQKKEENRKEPFIVKRKEEKNKDDSNFRSEEELDHILLMETYIYNNIKKQNKELKKFQRQMERLPFLSRKFHLIAGIKNFLGGTIRIAFSLFPLAYMKNKKIGFLTSAILVNNNIRTMRNAINMMSIPYIEYEKLAEMLRKGKDEIKMSKMVCYNSLEQLHFLREEFILKTQDKQNEEILLIIKQMSQLEKMIESRAIELDKNQEKISRMQIKNKQKVKKLENSYKKAS